MASYYLVLNSAFVTWVFQHTQAQANQVFEKSAILTKTFLCLQVMVTIISLAGVGDDNIWTFAGDGDDVADDEDGDLFHQLLLAHPGQRPDLLLPHDLSLVHLPGVV